MADGYVQVPPDNTGKKIDTTELTTAPSGVLSTVERQRVEIPDSVSVGGDLLVRILLEQRIQNLLLQQGLQIYNDVDGLRDELSDIAGLTIPDVRELLTEARTYYVSATGSDTNTGLSTANAFLTPQGAYDAIVAATDFGNQDVTIKMAAGTYSGSRVLSITKPWTGGGTLTIQGETADMNSVIFTATSADCVYIGCPLPGQLTIDYLKLNAASGTNCIHMFSSGAVVVRRVNFAAAGANHVTVDFPGANLSLRNAYTISGSAASHIYCTSLNQIYVDPYTDAGGSYTVTITGTPAFASGFARSDTIATIYADTSVTWSGSATGKRYDASLGSIINTAGSGATFFPGDVAGSTATGGQYI